MAAILTGMVTPSPSVPPPRRDGRRFAIPTPADLRHPQERRPPQPGQEESPEEAREGGSLSSDSAPEPSPSEPGTTAASASSPAAGPLATDVVSNVVTDVAPALPSVGAVEAGSVPRDSARTESATSGAPTARALAGPAQPTHPTPGTLPRPGRPRQDAGAGTLRAAEPIAPVRPAPPPPATAEPAPAQPRRMFPNPATLMAAGRGARKPRPGGLRARRLPKVEETSAGGVVLDLSCSPPAVALIARHDRRSRLLWSLPKGHVEEGETPEQAALREVFEETGLVGRIVAPLGIIDFWFVVEDKRIHKTVHHFVIEAIGGELSDEDLEVEAVEWIPYDQVVRRLAYGDERRLVEKVAQIVPGVR